MGQPIAKIEDRELVEQIKQAEATYNVSQATIRQRQADLKLAQNNLERSRSLFERDLLPRQTFDDTDARYQAARRSSTLAQAQMAQSKARLDELKINLANTVITSPVDGFIGKRTLDPGASVGVNTSFISVVDIRTVRLVINVVETRSPADHAGTAAEIEVDAYPGENFNGRVARVAPILDPATRTAQVEIEIPNPGFRLKPGMYARVRFTVERHRKRWSCRPLRGRSSQGKSACGFLTTRSAMFHARHHRHRAAGLHRDDRRASGRSAHHLDRCGGASCRRSHRPGRPARRRWRPRGADAAAADARRRRRTSERKPGAAARQVTPPSCPALAGPSRALCPALAGLWRVK